MEHPSQRTAQQRQRQTHDTVVAHRNFDADRRLRVFGLFGPKTLHSKPESQERVKQEWLAQLTVASAVCGLLSISIVLAEATLHLPEGRALVLSDSRASHRIFQEVVDVFGFVRMQDIVGVSGAASMIELLAKVDIACDDSRKGG